ncbi:MAG: DNA polymerase/3'-5' exonuclease PolX [Thermoleophilia bacterium]
MRSAEGSEEPLGVGEVHSARGDVVAASSSNAEVARHFQMLADYLSLDGASVYRTLAYQRAADTFRDYSTSVARLATEGRLRDLPAVGAAIEAKVLELVETGTLRALEELRAKFPETLLELMRLPGVGPKTARRLYETIGVTDLGTLRLAIDTGDLLKVPGMGEKSRGHLRRAVEALATRPERSLLGVVEPQAVALLHSLRALPGVTAADVAGSLRRRRSTTRDVDLVAASTDPEQTLEGFAAMPEVAGVAERGGTKLVVGLHSGLNLDLRVVAPASYGDLLQHSTGSAAHNVALRALAQKKGFKISEYTVEEAATGRAHRFADEDGVYSLLGLAWIPPELREDRGEIQAAAEGRLPRLLELDDLRGDLHVHSDWSDGRATMREMALAARDVGLEYICFSDHSQSLGMGVGLTSDQVRSQIAAIRELDATLDGITLLTGTEVDILADGRIDLPDDLLVELDFVTASIHSGFTQSSEQIMRRLNAALENPHVDAIGHPTGRLLTRRAPYEVDIDALVRGAARTRTILEINAAYHRLDLSAPHARMAKEAGALLTVSSDAHDPLGFTLLRYGVGEARRGWLEARDVLNTRPLAEVRAWLETSSGSGS